LRVISLTLTLPDKHLRPFVGLLEWRLALGSPPRASMGSVHAVT